ncbi:MAG: hypothetical protein JSU65_00805 [Candidatus Zixiibacteriota bacterium]|nr:MAG: hypothetical protein JSU65_00805 [candidate division Zixibacteria bacterium]
MKPVSQSEIGKIESITVKRPEDAFVSQEQIDAQWEELNYFGPPDFAEAVAEYEWLIDLISSLVPEIRFLPANDKTGLDSIYARDAAVVTNEGVILCNMGKGARRGEPDAYREFLVDEGIPILGSIKEPGKLEGGDIVWLDERTLVVGRGYRTNDDGIAQLREMTSHLVDELIVVPLPHWKGPNDVFHLMSFLSPIDRDLAVVYSPLMPVPFREQLIYRGIQLIEVPEDEYGQMACNVLALAPRKVITLDGNPITHGLMEDQGVEVLTYKGDEISRKGAGGPTCLTRPLQRLV